MTAKMLMTENNDHLVEIIKLHSVYKVCIKIVKACFANWKLIFRLFWISIEVTCQISM